MSERFTRSAIDWRRVSRAIDFYVSLGYEYVEVPWRVRDDVVRATKPPEATPFRCSFNDADRPDVLVGSAEQGLLELAARGEIEPGMYVSASPCFRDNETDALHFSDFFKIELTALSASDDASADVDKLRRDALAFAISESASPSVIVTPDGYDINVAGVEIGSYGVRHAVLRGRELRWAYGTGLAEPRFSQAMKIADGEIADE